MAIYTVHVPDNAPDALTRAERTVLLREGFSWRAFVFGLFYLLWHRLLLGAGVWVVLLVVLAALVHLLGLPVAAAVVLAGLMHLYLGIEGRDLLRWGLGRRGYTMRDLVSASGLSAAEAAFFTRQPDALHPLQPAPLPTARWMGPPPGPAVIGVFPDGDRP